MPGVRRTRSLVRKAESTRVSHHRFADTPAFPARWLYDLFRALSGDRAFLSPSSSAMRSIVAKLHASVEASRPRGFVVRWTSAFVWCATCGHRIPRPTSVTIAIRPSWWARDARQVASDLPDATSGIFLRQRVDSRLRLDRTEEIGFLAQRLVGGAET